MSLGRIDKVLGVYYEKDIKNGILTREQAESVITSFFKKLGGLRRAYQNATLGGTNTAGEYEWNELTVLILEVSKKLMIDQPLLTVRWSRNMPDRVWNTAFDLLVTGIGMPAFFNDAAVIKSKMHVGISEEDAYNYGVVGCVEVSVPGKEFAHTEGMRLNWAKVLELMFFGGECQYNGHVFALNEKRSLDSIKTFDEFYEWFKKELIHFLVSGMEVMNLIDVGHGQNSPTPYMSSLMRGCIRKGKDANAGGAVYNLTSVNGAAMADTVDSLCAVKKRCLKKNVSLFPNLQIY
jgi:formate C-acetyltransferase